MKTIRVSRELFELLASAYAARYRAPLDRVKKAGIVLTFPLQIGEHLFEPGHYEEPTDTIH